MFYGTDLGLICEECSNQWTCAHEDCGMHVSNNVAEQNDETFQKCSQCGQQNCAEHLNACEDCDTVELCADCCYPCEGDGCDGALRCGQHDMSKCAGGACDVRFCYEHGDNLFTCKDEHLVDLCRQCIADVYDAVLCDECDKYICDDCDDELVSCKGEHLELMCKGRITDVHDAVLCDECDKYICDDCDDELVSCKGEHLELMCKECITDVHGAMLCGECDKYICDYCSHDCDIDEDNDESDDEEVDALADAIDAGVTIEDAGGVYCVQITHITPNAQDRYPVSFYHDGYATDEFVMIKFGRSNNMANRRWGFAHEPVFVRDFHTTGEEWFKQTFPANAYKACFHPNTNVPEIQAKIQLRGKSPGLTEWRIVTQRWLNRLRELSTYFTNANYRKRVARNLRDNNGGNLHFERNRISIKIRNHETFNADHLTIYDYNP
jgi:hypothetical protein